MLGNAMLLVTAMIWGTAFVAQRVGMDSIEPVTFNAARMVLAAVVVGLLALILWRREQMLPSGRSAEEEKRYRFNTAAGGVCCGIVLSLASIFQQAGIVYTQAGKAGFITAMYILLVPGIGVVFLGRKNSWVVWLAVALGVTGMYFLCITDSFRLTRGDALVFICAVFFSLHILCCDHFARLGNPIRISAIQFVTASIISAAAAWIMEEPTMSKLYSAAIPILYCGIMSGGLGYTLQMAAQKYTDPTVASLIMSLESVFAAMAGALLLNEHMTAREMTGCVIMFIAIILVQIPLPAGKTEDNS